MRYQDIREAFPRFGVAVTDCGIMLVLPMYDPERYISQSINDREFENKHVLIQLLETCDTFGLHMAPGVGAYVLFKMPMPVDHNMLWQPIQPEPNPKDQDALVLNVLLEHDGGSSLFEKLEGVDLDDPDEILQALVDSDGYDGGNVYRLSDMIAWADLQKTAAELHAAWNFGAYSEEPPEDDLEFGVVSWYFETPSASAMNLEMNREQTKMFIDLCNKADVISIGGTVGSTDASLTFEFYS